jgi:pimeloyl-[acyl-carrier protein] methyl ester esterase
MDGTGELFAPLIKSIDQRINTRIVAYPTDEPLSYEALEARVRATLPDEKPFVLLGESFSGPIAISIAATPPKNLMGLILSCTFARRPLPWLSPFFNLTKHLPLEHAPHALIEHALMGKFATDALRTSLRRALASLQAQTLRMRASEAISVDYREKVSQIKTPCMYLQAGHDRVIPRRCGNEIVGANGNTKLLQIDGPHFLLQTKPHECAITIVDFVRTLVK